MRSKFKPRWSWTRTVLRDLSREDLQRLLKLPNVRESPFYTRLRGDKVQCTLCHRRCILDVGQVGTCGVRLNIDGKLYTVTYGLLTAVESRPMEIKPFFHYYPGSTALTISTWGCTFPCAWCQNWHLSKYAFFDRGEYYTPDEIVTKMELEGDEGINVSFNEPTLLTEFCLDVFRKARGRALHLSYNTNGYLTDETVKALHEAGMDGANVDIKGGRDTYRLWLCADFEKYWSTIKTMKRLGIHLELTYLVIPGVNDEDYPEIVERILRDLGPETPLHVTRFHPDHVLLDARPTPVDKLEEVIRYAKKQGLKYVYIGNVPGHPFEHTYCPECGKIVIKRYGTHVVEVRLNFRDGIPSCPECGAEIHIRGMPKRTGGHIAMMQL